jgi:HEAT repeat protein
VTPEERESILALAIVPGRDALSAEAFLKNFGATDGEALGLSLLRDAVARRDTIDVELALVVCFRFGFSEAHLPLLEALATASWHQRHEDVADALARVRSPTSVQALAHLASWVPEYLEYDDARALATKAIWALGAISDPGAHDALESLTRSGDTIVAKCAKAQLER